MKRVAQELIRERGRNKRKRLTKVSKTVSKAA